MQLDPNLILDLVNSVYLKDYMCIINHLSHLAKISTFSMLLITDINSKQIHQFFFTEKAENSSHFPEQKLEKTLKKKKKQERDT